MPNINACPQTIEPSITISDSGSTTQWMQITLNLNTNNQGPNVMHAALILYC